MIFCSISAAQQSTPAAAPSAAEDLVVLRISGQPVAESQVIEAIDAMAALQQLPEDRQPQRNALFYKGALDNLITIALLKNQARLQNIAIDAAEIEKQVQDFTRQYSSPEEFQKVLAQQGLTEADLRKNIETSMAMQKVLDLAVKDVPGAPEADLKRYYDDNTDKFMMPERVHVARILLIVDLKSTPEQKADLKKKLEGIRAGIESKTMTFADAAMKYSQDRNSASKGGDLGFLSRGQRSKAFENAAFATAPGALSPVVETGSGYDLIQTIEMKPSGKAPFEEVKPAIQRYLDRTVQQKAVQKYMEGLKEKATIERFMTQEEFLKRHPAK